MEQSKLMEGSSDVVTSLVVAAAQIVVFEEECEALNDLEMSVVGLSIHGTMNEGNSKA